ncbi:hypothetical protein PTKIN_Ptkin09bG0079900 [Pterospermum kingtungense]
MDSSTSSEHRSLADGFVDFKGNPVYKSKSGGWKSACFIIGVEVAERFAFFGISSNLITYLTGPLGQSTVTAAENVNAWAGTATLLPLLGAIVADSFLGRYRTIIFASLIYILGLVFLTLTAMLPSFKTCGNSNTKKITSGSSPRLPVILFFFSLYLVAIGQAGHKPCVQAFGADQFDGEDLEESKAKSSFFNWWYFGTYVGIFITLLIIVYVQDNLSWGLGFGIPCIVMVLALAVFLLGSRNYRYSIKGDKKNPFVRIGRVFIAAIKNWRASPASTSIEEGAHTNLHLQSSNQFRFLNKALLVSDSSMDNRKVCGVTEVEEAKAALGLVPIWATSQVYAVVCAQSSTFFTKQGSTMDRAIVSFKIPAASLQCFISLTIILFVPIYDRAFVPIARYYTGKPSGVTMLQRIGSGMFLSAMSMTVAALVEMKRLNTAKEYDLVNLPNATVPMSVWWLLPQYILFGVSDVFTMVGLQEFFYDQVPNELRSVGLSLYLSIFGVGNLLSSFLISIIDKVSSNRGRQSWFADNHNQAHLDYFYWLLAGLNVVGLAAFIYFAKSYLYFKKSTI